MNSDYKYLFNSDELLAILALSKDATAIYTTNELIIQSANDAMINFWGKDRSVVGRSFIKAIPELEGQGFFELLKEVWRTGVTYRAMDAAADLEINGELRRFYYDFEYRAIKNSRDEMYCILHTATDVSERHINQNRIDEGLLREQSLNEELSSTNEELLAANEEVLASNEELLVSRQELLEMNAGLEKRVQERTADVERERDRLHRFFMQAPAGICILDGPQLTFELVNPLYQALFPGRKLLGLSLIAALPELADSAIMNILKQVYETGKSYEAFELMVPLARTAGGTVEERYFNFIYQPRLAEDGKSDGILVFVIEVTDAILNRRVIEQKEASLRSVVMQSPYALMILRGRDWVIELANQQIANLWHKTLDEISGRKLLDVLPEISDQPFPSLLARVYDSGEGYGQEEEVLYLDSPGGQLIKYVSFFYDPMNGPDGTVDGIIVACEDITDKVNARKLLEVSYENQQSLNEELTAGNEELASLNEELAAINEELTATQSHLEKSLVDYELSEQRLRSLVESAPFPIGVYMGREMRILLANQSIIDVWGKGDEVVGKLYSEILPELTGQEIFGQLDRVYSTGEPFHARNQRVDIVVDERLQSFYFNYSFTPLFDAEGKVYGVMNTAAEVTDLQLALQKLARNEQDLHAMILQAPVAMCILLGPQHVIEVANRMMISLWGKPADQVLGKPVFEALPDAREQGLEDLLTRVYELGETYQASEMPVSLIRNGMPEVVYQNFVYQPYRDADGNILGVIAITTDVTEQVIARREIERNEKQLRETQKRLEKELEAGKLVQRQKDDFIGMASHELKTPLTSLGAIIQLAQLKLKNHADPFLAGAMDKAHVQIRRMTGMINGFLNISRLESGKLVIDKQGFDICVLLREMLEETKLTAPGRDLRINACQSLIIQADREKIGSVITNLLSNAIKYSSKDQPVTIDCALKDGQAEVWVKDEGMGISAEDLEKIFDRYYRVESSNTKHIAGFGIGLYLSAEIIKAHGGEISAESEADKGSVFSFRLPL